MIAIALAFIAFFMFLILGALVRLANAAEGIRDLWKVEP